MSYLIFLLAACKQSPPGVTSIGANMKKRRHGEEEIYYVPVSLCFIGCLGNITSKSDEGERRMGVGVEQG